MSTTCFKMSEYFKHNDGFVEHNDGFVKHNMTIWLASKHSIMATFWSIIFSPLGSYE